MVKVRVSETIAAERHTVWSELARIEDHVEWMSDATAIRFLSIAHSGVGTRFECDTRIGPLRLTDVMEIGEWEAPIAMGVRHSGVVSGSGRFTLADVPGCATRVTWEEQLHFPWWLGSGAGALVAKPVFTVLWKQNLRRFCRRVMTGELGAAPFLTDPPEQGEEGP
jgi:hypothetical protein